MGTRSATLKSEKGASGSHRYQDLELDVQIARRPRFYYTLISLPILLLYLLSPMVFLLPAESGEKTSMSITILLAEVVSMGNIADVLPESSINFPILTYFLAISILQMGLNTILTVLGELMRLELNDSMVFKCENLLAQLLKIVALKFIVLNGADHDNVDQTRLDEPRDNFLRSSFCPSCHR